MSAVPNNVTPIRYGATPADWDYFVGLGWPLLPVVSNPNIPTSATSKLPADNRGKVPSVLNAGGQVVGIEDWPKKCLTASSIGKFSERPDFGICVLTGSGKVVAIDVDVTAPELAAEILAEFPADVRRRVRPNSSKFLVPVLTSSAPQKTWIDTRAGRIELLGKGQQFVAAGMHPSGAHYEWTGETLLKADPRALWARLQKFAAAPYPAATPTADRTPVSDLERQIALHRADETTITHLRGALTHLDPNGYETWVSVGQNLKSLGEQGFDLWIEWSKRATAPASDDELDRKWDHDIRGDRSDFRAVFTKAQAAGWKNPGTGASAAADPAKRAEAPAGLDRVDQTDVGNAVLIWQNTRGDIRYIPERETWVTWDGRQWNEDVANARVQSEIVRVSDHYFDRAKALGPVIEGLEREVAAAPDKATKEKAIAELKKAEDQQKSLTSWARYTRNRSGISNAVAVMRQDARFVLSQGQLNRDPYLLGVQNGVVDLRTGELRPEGRDDFITRRATVDYEPDAKALRWEQFVAEITGLPGADDPKQFTPRPQLVEHVRRMVGYCFTGLTTLQVMWLLNGAGSNGKSQFMDALKYIAGPLWVKMPAGMLLSRDAKLVNPEGASPGVARLQGVRAAVSSEIKEDQVLDSNFIKQHTGERELAARRLHREVEEFVVTHKLLLQSNAIPKLDELDGAIRGRLLMIPFDRKWNRPGETPDPSLPDGDPKLGEVLRSEAPGILAWIVRGAVAFFKDGGFGQCLEVQGATQRYFEKLDGLGRWKRERTERCRPSEGMSAAELLEDMVTWSLRQEDEVPTPASAKAMFAALVKAGVHHQRVRELAGAGRVDRGELFALRPKSPTPSTTTAEIFK